MKTLKRQAKPDYFFEDNLRKLGYKYIAGADEVGRGCFAGPVVAGCVVFKKACSPPKNIKIDDSKRLTPKQREMAEVWIKQKALVWAVGKVPASMINRIGMAQATKVAFRKAVAQTRRKVPIDFLLIDAFYIPWVKGLRRKNQKAIIDGDQKSFSIAAASIVAKVYRDKLMQRIARNPKYKKYDWGKNKGYGTKTHQKAIIKLGLTRYHRRVFVETFLNNSASSQAQSGA